MKAKEMTPQDYEQQARSMRRFLGTTWGFGVISTTGSSKNIPQSTSQSLSSQAVASTGLKTSGRSMGEESARRWLLEQLDPLARLTEEQIKEAEEMGLL